MSRQTNEQMTLHEKRVAAGRKGGKKNVRLHLVHRETNEIKAYLSGKKVPTQEQAS